VDKGYRNAPIGTHPKKVFRPKRGVGRSYQILSGGMTYTYLDGSSVTGDNFHVGIRGWFVLCIDNTMKSHWKEGG